jgi:hypothetical protein
MAVRVPGFAEDLAEGCGCSTRVVRLADRVTDGHAASTGRQHLV